MDLTIFKTALDAYSVSMVEAQDGGKKAIALRNQRGRSIERMLRALAAYVEFIFKEDINVFLTSGFRLRSGVRAASQPIGAAKVDLTLEPPFHSPA